MINKMIKKIILGLLFVFGGANAAVQANFKFEQVSLDRIDSKAQAFYKHYRRARNAKFATYSILGTAVVAGAVWIIRDQYKKSKEGVPAVTAGNAQGAKESLAAARFADWLRKKSFSELLSDQVTIGVVAGLTGIILAAMTDTAKAGANAFRDFVAWGNNYDVKSYKEKLIKLREMMIGFANISELCEKQGLPEVPNKALLEIALSDLHLTHRTMVHFLEDLFAFIKFLVMLGNGEDEWIQAVINSSCITLSIDFNNVSKEIALIINGDKNANKQTFISAYADFCRNFTKFVSDCGVSLYGQDFLQK